MEMTANYNPYMTSEQRTKCSLLGIDVDCFREQRDRPGAPYYLWVPIIGEDGFVEGWKMIYDLEGNLLSFSTVDAAIEAYCNKWCHHRPKT